MHCSTAQKAAQCCQNCHIRLAKYYCDKVRDTFLLRWCLVPSMGRFSYKVYLSLCGLRHLSCGWRPRQGLFPLQGMWIFYVRITLDLQCLHVNVAAGLSSMYRTQYRMWLSDMRRLSVHLSWNSCVHAVWAFYSPEMLQSTYQIVHTFKIIFWRWNRSYRCPTCSRALINMDHYFRLLDVEVRRQPMPPPYDSWQTVILWYELFCNCWLVVTIAPPRVEYLSTLWVINATCTITFFLDLTM